MIRCLHSTLTTSPVRFDRLMAAIKYSPYIPNVDAWVKFYQNQPREYKRFYTIGKPKHKGEDMDPIKLVTPTESVTERAKSTLKRDRAIEEMILEGKRPIRKPKNKTLQQATKNRVVSRMMW